MTREVFRMALPALLLVSIHGMVVQADETVSIQAAQDAFVTSAQPTNNYGAAGALAIAAAGLPKGESQSVLRFDTAAARTALDAAFGPGQWTITGATLRLTAAAPNNPIFNAVAAGKFSLEWMADDTWVEGTGTPSAPATSGVTFAGLPGFLGPADEPLGTFTFDGSTSGSRVYALALSPGLLADLAAGGLASLRAFAADAQLSYVCNSRNFGTAASRPELSITAVPEPGGLWLLAAGFALIRRRSRT